MKFFIMDHTGHTTLEFKKDELAEAMEKFNDLVKKQKNVAAVRTGPAGSGTAELVRDFPPDADEILFHRQLVGG